VDETRNNISEASWRRWDDEAREPRFPSPPAVAPKIAPRLGMFRSFLKWLCGRFGR
jgi:hypothetical protein